MLKAIISTERLIFKRLKNSNNKANKFDVNGEKFARKSKKLKSEKLFKSRKLKNEKLVKSKKLLKIEILLFLVLRKPDQSF